MLAWHRITCLLRWLNYQLSGPERVRQCEYRREARITCVRSGRHHRAA